jgi:tetratricopeptide (TPR) repeat protein
MKIITKEISIDELILKVKTNYKNSEKYFLLSTKEVIHLIEEEFNVHCPDLKSTPLTCFVEQSPKEYSHPLIIIEIDKKFVKKEELEQFVQMQDELFSLIMVAYKLDYDVEADFLWFVNKILDDPDLNSTQLTIENKDNDFKIKNDILEHNPIVGKFFTRPCNAPFYDQAIALQHKGEYLESLKFLKIVHQLDTGVFTYFLLAQCYYHLKNYSKSIDYVKESLKFNNQNAVARILLSYDYFYEGHFEKALKELENIDRTNLRLRDMVDVEIQLGKISLALGYDEKSNFHFKNAEEITPEKFKPALINLILIKQYSFYEQINDYQKCSDILKILISRMPSKIEFLTNLMSCQINLNQFFEVEKTILQALNSDGNKWEYLFMLFTVYYKQNKTLQALDVYNKLIKFKDKLPSKVFDIIYHAEKQLKENEEKQKILHFDDVLNQLKSQNENVKSNNISSIEPHPIVSYEQLRRTEIQCLEIVRQYIRIKYSKNINLLKEDQELFSRGYDGQQPYDNYTYKKIEQSLREKEDSISEQKPISDLFDCMDFGFFPYIFRKKSRSWRLAKKISSLFDILTPNRNTPAHFSGPDELGNLSPLDAQLHYVTCRKIIIYFEDKMRI